MKAPMRCAVALCFVCIPFFEFESIPAENLRAMFRSAKRRGSSRPCDGEAVRNGLWLERRGGGNETPDDRGDYEWSVPTSTRGCSFRGRFDAGDFCDLMGNAVVLVLGDSISFEQYASLVRLATNGIVISGRLKYCGRRRGLPVIVNSCGRGNVTLVWRIQIGLGSDRWSIPVDEMLTQMPPTAIVLNTGAHYRKDGMFLSTLRPAIEALEAWQRRCVSRNNVTCPFFYRTTYPGIPRCTEFTAPENNQTRMEEHVAAPDPGKQWNAYHWKDFKRQNGLVLDALASSELRYEVLPGYEMGLTRPDVRKSDSDCLHSRVPAIADAENAALLHHLNAVLSEDDVANMAKLDHGFDRRTNVNGGFNDMNWGMVDSAEYPYKYTG